MLKELLQCGSDLGTLSKKWDSISLGTTKGDYMYKIAVIEEVHEDGIKLLENNPNFEYKLITDPSEKNLIKELPNFDGCTLRVSNLGEIF